jgi:hypothetical protein
MPACGGPRLAPTQWGTIGGRDRRAPQHTLRRLLRCARTDGRAELTHVEKGSPGCEYLRRLWQPVALTSEVTGLPLKVRMFGEDLILLALCRVD